MHSSLLISFGATLCLVFGIFVSRAHRQHESKAKWGTTRRDSMIKEINITKRAVTKALTESWNYFHIKKKTIRQLYPWSWYCFDSQSSFLAHRRTLSREASGYPQGFPQMLLSVFACDTAPCDSRKIKSQLYSQECATHMTFLNTDGYPTSVRIRMRHPQQSKSIGFPCAKNWASD